MRRIRLPLCIAFLAVVCSMPTWAEEEKMAESACRRSFIEDQMQTYDPIYFVVGEDGAKGFNAKFQISVDFEIFCRQGMASRMRPLRQIHFSFSQTSLWDLSELSSPFRDSSYRPRLFYRVRDAAENPTRTLTEFDIGIAHESNGKAGVDSRSVDMAFIRPKWSFAFGDQRQHELNVQPMIYAYTGKSRRNEDVADYRGNVDLHIEYLSGPRGSDGQRTRDPWAAWVNLRKGKRDNFGSIELSVAVPYRSLPLVDSFNGWLMVQYFNGYGETLLDYNRKLDSQVRAGFCIII